VKSVLVAAMTALVVSLLGTPAAIKLFRRRGYGQEIREDGPSSHATKRGTPTMGGTVIIAAALIGYGVAHLLVVGQRGRGPTASALLVLALMTGLGLVGFLDDFIKIRKQRSLGLTAAAKFGGQKPAQWNTMLIESRPEMIRVSLNGEVVSQSPGDQKRPKSGPIGLQLHDQFTFVMFRNIKIREQ